MQNKDILSENNIKQISENFDKETIELLEQFLEKIKGKNMAQTILLLSEFKEKLPKDRIFSKKEKDIIIEAALNSVPEEEKNRYKNFLKMMKAV